MVVEAAGGVECAVDGGCGADGWRVVGVGGECCVGVHVGVGLLVGCLLGWWCGVVPVFVGALEEDEWWGVGSQLLGGVVCGGVFCCQLVR